MELLRQQWDNIKLAIKDEYELTGIAFNIWVKPLQFLKCENNVVSILVPGGNPEMLDYVKINYTNYFQEAISQALADNFTVEFTLEEEKYNNEVNDTADKDNNDNTSSSSLNPKYHFENFVVGSNNRMAHSVCLRVAETPGTELNPLFIHGGSGLGKTHLMTAIGHYITENTKLKVLYVTSENFLNEVIESIRNNANVSSMTRLREKYRNIDVLLIDDIQFLIGRGSSSQVEFFNTFNTLVQNGKQIVITSDKHPKHIKELDERMRTRFLNGMIVDIAPPAYETRVAILRKYAENFTFKVPDNIIDYIANHIRSDVRELEGAYKKVCALGEIDGDMTLEKAKDLLKEIISPDNPSVITPSLILKGISEYYNIDADDITSKKRNAEIVLPRQIFMYLCREMTDTTLQGVAALLDKKDHSTVLHGYNKISKEININTELKESIEAIKNIIKTY